MRVPTGSYSAEIVVRRSRFIACGLPLENSSEAKARVLETRAEHPGCNHVVWAFLCGPAAETAGMSDDHEPKGTAGRPVLEVIRGSGITNILITVTRYFGGTKLGTGGLVRAYTDAAKLVVEGIPTSELIDRRPFRLELPYDLYELVRRALEELGAIIDHEAFTDFVLVEGRIAVTEEVTLTERVTSVTSGRVALELPETP